MKLFVIFFCVCFDLTTKVIEMRCWSCTFYREFAEDFQKTETDGADRNSLKFKVIYPGCQNLSKLIEDLA